MRKFKSAGGKLESDPVSMDGLKIAYGSLVFQMPTVREKVCLVDAWVTGCVYQNHATYGDRVRCVLQQNYVGTKNAANTLLAVGRWPLAVVWGVILACWIPKVCLPHYLHSFLVIFYLIIKVCNSRLKI